MSPRSSAAKRCARRKRRRDDARRSARSQRGAFCAMARRATPLRVPSNAGAQSAATRRCARAPPGARYGKVCARARDAITLDMPRAAVAVLCAGETRAFMPCHVYHVTPLCHAIILCQCYISCRCRHVYAMPPLSSR